MQLMHCVLQQPLSMNKIPVCDWGESKRGHPLPSLCVHGRRQRREFNCGKQMHPDRARGSCQGFISEITLSSHPSSRGNESILTGWGVN